MKHLLVTLMLVLGTTFATAQTSKTTSMTADVMVDMKDMPMPGDMGVPMTCPMCDTHKATIMDMKMKMMDDMMMGEKMVMDITMLKATIVELTRYKRHAMMVLKDGQKRKVMKMIEMEMMKMNK